MRKLIMIITVFMVLFSLAGFSEAKEFYGVVQALPAQGFVGQWTISNKTVYVTEETKIKQKYAKVAVGSYVEVEGVTWEGKFIAAEIETKKKKSD